MTCYFFQVGKHISGKTTTQEENVPVKSLKLPHLTFCSQKPYKKAGPFFFRLFKLLLSNFLVSFWLFCIGGSFWLFLVLTSPNFRNCTKSRISFLTRFFVMRKGGSLSFLWFLFILYVLGSSFWYFLYPLI